MAAILLFLGMFVGLLTIPFGIPGTFIILGSILVYALATDFSAAISVPFFIFLCVLTVIAETADNWLTAAGARRYGGSRSSMWLSVVGGLLGAIVLGGPAAMILGPLGPVAGGLLGAFCAVVGYELHAGKSRNEAFRAGWGSFLGRLAGIGLKLVIAVAMITAVAVAMLF